MHPHASIAIGALLACALLAACGERDAAHSATRGLRRSVLLITIDTLRADHLGCTGWARARTPRLDALAGTGQLYRNAIAAAPLTLPSHATLLSGLLPQQHGARDNKPFRFPADKLDTIATTLRGRGYRTFAAIGGEPLARGCGLERDFESYDDAFPRTSPGSVRLGERPANLVTDAALAAVDRAQPGQPFFMFVHYFDPHDPYLPPKDLLAAFADAPYDGEIAFVDREIGRLLDGLKARGIGDDLVILVTADHGESLGEHGEASHGFFVYDATIRVPLIVRAPGAKPGRFDEQVRLQDVRAFLEALAAGDEADLGAPARRGDPALIESLYGQLHCDFAQLRGLRSPRGFKYLESGNEEWFDIAADPGEQHDLLAQADGPPADEVARARAALDAALASANASSAGGGLAEVGYVGTPSAPETVHTFSRAENATRATPRSKLVSIRALTEGVRLLDGRQVAAAVQVLDAARADDANNPALLFHLARALGKLAAQDADSTHLDRAIAMLKTVRQLRPALMPARDLLLFDLFQRGEFAAAKDLYTAAVADKSATASTFEAMARIRLNVAPTLPPRQANPLADEEAAFEDLEHAVERGATPALVDLLKALELGYSQQGRTLQADRIRKIHAEAAQNLAREP